MALTGKRKAFADAVLEGKTNREAAIAAGYSVKTASPAGSRLAKDPVIVEYIGRRRAQAGTAPLGQQTTQSAPPANTFDINKAVLFSDPKDFLLAAMNDTMLLPKERIDAAKALMPFTNVKLGEGGKKDAKAAAAKSAAGGRFGAPPPPKLVVNNGN